MITEPNGETVYRGDLTEQEIVVMREMAHGRQLAPSCDEDGNVESGLIEELATEFNTTPEIVAQVLDGEIMQAAGGPLRPLPLQGCNPKYLEATRNRQRFVRGVVQRAYAILTEEQFEVFANSHGMTMTEAKFYLRNLGASSDQLNNKRYRGVLLRHAAGQGIEQAISSFNKRARVNSD